MTAPAKPSSAGAHRLAWWLMCGTGRAESPRPMQVLRARQFARAARISGAMIERIVRGELQPAEETAAAIARATHGFVDARDWDSPAGSGWRVRPRERAA